MSIQRPTNELVHMERRKKSNKQQQKLYTRHGIVDKHHKQNRGNKTQNRNRRTTERAAQHHRRGKKHTGEAENTLEANGSTYDIKQNRKNSPRKNIYIT